MGLFSRKHKKEKQQTKVSEQPSQSEGRPYEPGGTRYSEPGYTQPGQPGQYGSTQQRYDQQTPMSQQPETGYRSGGGYQSGGGGGGNPPYRSGSTGYNPAPEYGPSSGYKESGYREPSGGRTGDTHGGRHERQYDTTSSQRRNERYESGRRNNDDYTQGPPGRYPDTYRSGGYDASGGGRSSGGYGNRQYEEGYRS